MLRMSLHSLAFSRGAVSTIWLHCSEGTGPDVSDPKTWMCLICGWIYDEAAGDPEHGLAPGTAWAHLDTFAWNEATRPGRPEGGEALGLRALLAFVRGLILD